MELKNGLSVKHEAIMDFLMGNPQVRLKDVAAHFGITQGWLSQVIHSDAFQGMLREKQDVVFHSTVLPLREKMQVIAHMTLDKMTELTPLETELPVLNTQAENLLDKLGFGSKAKEAEKPGTTVVVNVLREELAAARVLVGRVEVNNGTRAAEEISREGSAPLGSPSPFPSLQDLRSAEDAA